MGTLCAGRHFFAGAAGSAVIHSAAIGFLLLAIQIFSALLVGGLFRPARGDTAPTQATTNALRPFSRCLTESVQQAASATVNVCAFVIFFNVVLRLLDCCGLFGLIEYDVVTILKIGKMPLSRSTTNGV